MIDFTNPMRVLEALTAGGSEYYNDPKRCYEDIRRTLDKRHELMVKFKLQRDELEEKVRTWEMLHPDEVARVNRIAHL